MTFYFFSIVYLLHRVNIKKVNHILRHLTQCFATYKNNFAMHFVMAVTETDEKPFFIMFKMARAKVELRPIFYLLFLRHLTQCPETGRNSGQAKNNGAEIIS